MIIRSLQAKLISIYLVIVILFIGVLGGVLTWSYRRNLTKMREKDLLECAEQIAAMFTDGTLTVQMLENGMNMPVLMTTAKDFDATIQVVNTATKRIFYQITEKKMTVSGKNELVEDAIYQTVFEQNRVYLCSNYYNKKMEANVSTIAYPIRYQNSSEQPWAILIINSNLKVVNDTFLEIVSALWIPAIVISVLGLTIIFLLTQGIVKRVKILKEATGKIAKGKFDERIEFSQHDEISQLAVGFNQMAEDLAASDKSKRDFVSNAAHELRSPMTSINGFVEGMLDGTIPQSEYRTYLEIVSSEVKRLTKLVKTMLDLSRIESGREKLSLQSVDINELIRRVVLRFGQKIENKGIIPELHVSDERLMAVADADKIEQVLQNLIDNAVKFTQAGKKIYLCSYKKGNKVYITVRDEGAGISEEEVKFIWDRFYTVDKAHTGHKSGTGLGLSIVKSILEQHGQTITVKSKLGAGTDFTFTLDAAADKE